MSRTVKTAAIQMDATPAPVSERLERAAKLVADAAKEGAQLALLPEVFNTGYEYSDQNYKLAETMDGQTVTWMKQQASKHKAHIGGTLFLIDGDDVYNAFLLIAPDGHTWRYDKNFPWAWERAFFREGRTITIADTDLGKFGMMICWDYAHPELWRRYAGKVDAMLISSCPPKTAEFDTVFSDGSRYNLSEGFETYHGDDMPFGADMDAQAAWLRVPLVNTAGSGEFKTTLPLPVVSLAGIVIGKPDLWPKMLDAKKFHMECGYYPQTKVVDANGEVLVRVEEEGDAFVISEMELADVAPKPLGRQPKGKFTPYSYFISDWLTPTFMTPLYRRGYRRQLGEQMAPVDYSTRVWSVITLSLLVWGWLLGRSSKSKPKRQPAKKVVKKKKSPN
jgi:hypothetical protein